MDSLLEKQATEIQAIILEARKNEARFQFASAALVGILSNWEGSSFPPRQDTAITAFEYADAMLAESVK